MLSQIKEGKAKQVKEDNFRMSGYIESINNSIVKINKSDVSNILNLTLINYEEYLNFFVSIQEKKANDGQAIDSKINTLNSLNMHSTFLIDGFLKNIIINSYSSTKIILRSIIELYIKYKFILQSDTFVAKVYSDFSKVTLMKQNYDLNLSVETKKLLDQAYEVVNKIYNLNGKFNDDMWIKISLDHVTKKTNNEKSLQAIVEYLEEKKCIQKWTYKSYKINCDFNHIGANSLDELQYIDLKIEEGKFKEAYYEMLASLNYIIWDIYKSYVEFYKINDVNIKPFKLRMDQIMGGYDNAEKNN